jgi:hypothetical protein
MLILFRRSINRNAFGLRGYWVYDPHTLRMTSFAASADYALGQRFDTTPFGELQRDEGTMPKAWAKRLPLVARLLTIRAVASPPPKPYAVRVSKPTAKKVCAHFGEPLPAKGDNTSLNGVMRLSLSLHKTGHYMLWSLSTPVSGWPVAFGVEVA